MLCVYTQRISTKMWRTLIHRMITKQRVKIEQIERKQTCSLCLVNVFKFQVRSSRSFKRISREVKIILKKRFLGKATGHNDHYWISISGQKPKTGGNWPLTGPYFQSCLKQVFPLHSENSQENWCTELNFFLLKF